jgi:hypothetical protein
VIGLPPSLDGGVNATDALVAVGVADTPVGAPGTVVVPLPVVKLDDAAEFGPVPIALVALTLHVYALSAVSPVTTMGLAPPTDARVTPPLVLEHVAM